MTAAPSLDWLFALLGYTLALVGAAWLLWALFWDRARGRKRCPRCWYDMAGASGARCPECGKETTSAKRLRKTRRRWRWAAAACLVLVAGSLVHDIPAIKARGWWAAAPRIVIIAALPWADTSGAVTWRTPVRTGLAAEIPLRLLPETWQLAGLWWPERWLLGVTSARAVEHPTSDYTTRLAAHLLVMVRDDPLKGISEGHRAPVLLAISAKAYGTCRSYRDVGIGDDMPFRTAFVRPDAFRYEFTSTMPGAAGRTDRFVVWLDGPTARTFWTISSSLPNRGTLSMALAGGTGISHGTAHTVPCLLLPDQLGGRALTDLRQAVVAAIEERDGVRCYRIEGAEVMGTRTVWLDASTLLMRRIQETTSGFTFTADYHPEINIDIAPAALTFDPDHPDAPPTKEGGR